MNPSTNAVGIRPHDLLPAAGGAGESPRIPAVVDISEHTGTEVFATMDVGDVRVIARLPRSPIPEPGDRVELAFRRDGVHLFDAQSQLSLLNRTRERERAATPAGSAHES